MFRPHIVAIFREVYFGIYIIVYALLLDEGWNSSVGIATDYRFDGAGIEFRLGRNFPHPSRRALRPTQPLYNRYRVLPGGKAAGAWR